MLMNRISVLAWLSLFLILNGCSDDGPKLFKATGKISFADGSTARFGVMESRSEGLPRSIGRAIINKDGTFSFKTAGNNGLAAGSHYLLIQQDISRSSRGVVHNHGLEVDNKYRAYETTDLKIKVDPKGGNHFELTVDSK